MKSFYCLFALWWIFFYIQLNKAKVALDNKSEEISWVFDFGGWLVYKIICIIWGKEAARKFAQSRRVFVYRYYKKIYLMYKVLSIILAILSLLQCFLDYLFG